MIGNLCVDVLRDHGAPVAHALQEISGRDVHRFAAGGGAKAARKGELYAAESGETPPGGEAG